MSEHGTSVLEIADLTVARGAARQPELDRFSLQLGAGETIVILGETGCGKEALVRALCGISGPDERVTGAIRFGNAAPALKASREQSGLRVAYLPGLEQAVLSPTADALSQLVRVVSRKLGLPRASAREELRITLGRIEGAPPLAALRGRPAALDPGTLAFGLFATALAQSPDLILADHPLAKLSPLQARNLAMAMIAGQKRLGFALLYAARATLETTWLGGRVLIMRSGRIVEEGPVARLMSPQAHAYTQLLYKSAAMDLPPEKHAGRGEPILQVRGLKLTEKVFRRPASAVTFDLRRGSALALLGEDGSGRRDLMRAMLGLERAAAGRTIFDSVDIGILSRSMVSRLRRRIAFISGDDDVLDPRMTVRDTVEEPLRAHLSLAREHMAGYREAALKRVGLNTMPGDKAVAALSSFDRRRLQVARAIVSVPRLAVIEEPLRGLGPLEQSVLLDLLGEFRAQEGPAFLILTADFALARALADDIMVVRDRQVVERGSAAELMQSAQDAYTRSLIESVAPKPEEGLSLTVPQG